MHVGAISAWNCVWKRFDQWRHNVISRFAKAGEHGRGVETHFVEARLTGGGTLSTPVRVPYGPGRDWRQKWRDITDGVQRLQTVHSGDAIKKDELRRQVEDLFEYMRELADWLDEDVFGGQRIAKAAVNDVHTYPALVIGDGVAQTEKHRRRRPSHLNPDPVTARAEDAHGDGTAVCVDIPWSRPSGPMGIEDALDLARRCVQEWQQFFTLRSLNP
jgi:hypothetical protein